EPYRKKSYHSIDVPTTAARTARGSCRRLSVVAIRLVDEARADEGDLAGVDGSVVDHVPGDEVHLRHGPRAVGVHRLDVGDVADRAFRGDHDRAHRGRRALREAVRPGAGDPLVRVPEPGDVPPAGDPVGAEAEGEVVGPATRRE